MPKRIQMYDGNILELPDDATDEAIDEAAQEYISSKKSLDTSKSVSFENKQKFQPKGFLDSLARLIANRPDSPVGPLAKGIMPENPDINKKADPLKYSSPKQVTEDLLRTVPVAASMFVGGEIPAIGRMGIQGGLGSVPEFILSKLKGEDTLSSLKKAGISGAISAATEGILSGSGQLATYTYKTAKKPIRSISKFLGENWANIAPEAYDRALKNPSIFKGKKEGEQIISDTAQSVSDFINDLSQKNKEGSNKASEMAVKKYNDFLRKSGQVIGDARQDLIDKVGKDTVDTSEGIKFIRDVLNKSKIPDVIPENRFNDKDLEFIKSVLDRISPQKISKGKSQQISAAKLDNVINWIDDNVKYADPNAVSQTSSYGNYQLKNIRNKLNEILSNAEPEFAGKKNMAKYLYEIKRDIGSQFKSPSAMKGILKKYPEDLMPTQVEAIENLDKLGGKRSRSFLKIAKGNPLAEEFSSFKNPENVRSKLKNITNKMDSTKNGFSRIEKEMKTPILDPVEDQLAASQFYGFIPGTQGGSGSKAGQMSLLRAATMGSGLHPVAKALSFGMGSPFVHRMGIKAVANAEKAGAIASKSKVFKALRGAAPQLTSRFMGEE